MTPTKVGEIRTTSEIARWHECEQCGMPARYKCTFLLEGARRNPNSKAYGKDDCSWCSDLDIYACEKHKNEIWRDHDGYVICSCFPLKNFKHMGFYWEKKK